MKRLVLALLFLLASPLSAATISGTVTQSGSTTALPGMTVQAYDASGFLKATATTDVAGRYSLTLTTGTYRLLAFDAAGVYATNFYKDAESFETSTALALQASLTKIDFALRRAGSIAGTITSAPDAPLMDITVEAYNPDGTRRAFTTTDAVGHYQLVLPPGNYRLAAFDKAQNYLTSFYSHQSSFATATVVPVAEGLTATADFVLTAGAILAGTISDAGGASIVSAHISVYSGTGVIAEAVSDSAGHYRLLLGAGSYRVVAFDPSGTYATNYLIGAESFDTSSVFVLPGGETRTLDATLVRAGLFTGFISNDAGLLLPNITVVAYNLDGTTRGSTLTNDGGAYTLALPPGSYRLAAYDSARVYLTRFFPNERASLTAMALTAIEGRTLTANLTLPRGAVVSGKVVNPAGASIDGIVMSAFDRTGPVSTTTSDSSGNYRLLLEAGAYTLAAFDPRFKWATGYAFIAVTLGQDLPGVNFVLVNGAHVSGFVTGSGGTPLMNATVEAYDTNGRLISTAATRHDGGFDLVLAPATYRFGAFDSARAFIPALLSQPYTLGVSTVSQVTFQLTAARRRAARR